MSSDYLFAPERYESHQFIIRSYLPGDGALLTEAVNASYDHLKTFMPWAKSHQSEEMSEQLVRQFRGRYLLAEDFTLGIFSPDESQLLGGTGFHLRNQPLANRNAEIGMWIRASAAGKGLGSAVLRAMLRWGFSEWAWERLAWRCDGRNVASQRTAQKAGMIQEGILRGVRKLPDGTRQDTFCYAALRGNQYVPHRVEA